MYESFYGLHTRPFQLSPDPAFFFESRGHKRAFAYLQYGVAQGEGFIVLTGEVGAGKTTVVRSLLEQLDPDKIAPVLLVSTQLQADQLVVAVAEAFGLAARDLDKAQLLRDLERYLVSIASRGRHGLLIVDEAQNLPPAALEELRMLSNFQLGGRSLVQSFLVGQPELRELIRGPQAQALRQRVVAACHLSPLPREETQAYIEHRLQCAGWSGDPAFEPEVFDAIHAFTQGTPRRINTLCDRLLLGGYLAESHRISADDVRAEIRELEEELGREPGAVEASAPVPPNAGSAPVQPPPAPELHALHARMARLERALINVVKALDLRRTQLDGTGGKRTGSDG
jgi:putative secretion ATPase (PEP-CTERM system associated)